MLTRAWPGSQPNAIDRGGGVIRPPPQATSQTNDRNETGEAALFGLGETVRKHS